MIKCAISFLLLVVFSLCVCATTPSQDRHRPVLVRFPRGRTSAVLKGKIINTSHIYTLRARAGQTITLHLTSAEGIAYFTLVGPNAEGFIGGQGRDWSGVLPTAGAYDVIVGVARESRGEGYTLEVSIR